MTEEMGKILKMEKEIAECQNDMHGKINAINMKLLEQDTMRSAMNGKLDNIVETFKSHTKEEMEKYEKINVALEDLTLHLREVINQTKENTGYIMSIENDAQADRIKEAVLKEERDRVAKIEEPRKRMKEKIIMTAIGVTTATVIAGLLSIMWFGFKAYVMLGVE